MPSPSPAPKSVIVLSGMAPLGHDILVVWEKTIPKLDQVFVRSRERKVGDAQLSF